jgi:hypothetical protein
VTAAPQPPDTVSAGVRLIDGPPAPVAPDTLARDSAGRATVRAVRLTEPLKLDGMLDEKIYQTVPALSGFIQQLPNEGAAATERTEAWVFYDGRNTYVSARLWSSVPESQWIANEMQRDSCQVIFNDNFTFVFDTFYDRRNGVAFMVNPIGGVFDYQITDERNPNSDWNPIWDVRTGRFDGGWTVEAQVPFKSLRFRPGPSQVWGFQLGRMIRSRNESTYLTRVPISAGPGGFRLSAAGTLVGVEVPENNRILDIKPYAIGSLTTDRMATPRTSNQIDRDGGIDIKYGVTPNLIADFTYNTDFAQVEADEQQVNLTQFPLFFPEKREFNGHITAVSHQRGRIALTPQLSIQPGLSINRIELPETAVTLTLVTSRVTFTATPRMFVSGLMQYNSSASSLSANFRFRWEYRPGSELFLVYNDLRDTSQRGILLLENRAFVVKVTRQFRL